MADEKDIRNQKDLNNETREGLSLEQEILAVLTRRAGISADLFDTQQDVSNTFRDQLRSLKFQAAEKRLLRSIDTEINNIARDAYGLGQDELGTQQNINKLKKDRVRLDQSIRVLDQQRLKFLAEADRLSKSSDEGERRKARLQRSLAETAEEQIESATRLRGELDDQVLLSEKLQGNLSGITFGGIAEGLQKAGLGGLAQTFERAAEASRQVTFDNLKIDEASEEIKALGKGATEEAKEAILSSKGLTKETFAKGKLNPFLQGIKSVGPALRKALGPIALIAELVKGIFEADKQITELAKGMALTKTEAAAFRSELAFAANTSSDLYVTSTKLVESFSALNKQFGFITNFSTETLVAMAKLTERVGIASDAAGNLAAASLLNGKSLDENYKNVLGTSYELQRQRGIQFDLRDILSEVGKTTGQIRANLRANPKAIAEAVTQAKLLGSNLQDIAGAAKSFLDFESSITSELEAELLLGRNINLERARAAALQGDLATVAQEVAKQAGDFETFTKLNVIQQDALAQSLGFTSDQLSDILFKQETQNKSAKELRALGKNDLADRVEQKSVQEDFNALIQKLKGLFVDVGTAIAPILDLATSLLKIFEPLFHLIGYVAKGIASVFNGISGNFDGASVSATNFEKSATASIKRVSEAGKNVGGDISKSIGKGAYYIEEATKKAKEDTGDFFDNLYKDKGIKLQRAMNNKDYQEHLQNLGNKAKSVIPKVKETAINVRNQAEDKAMELTYRTNDLINTLVTEQRKNNNISSGILKKNYTPNLNLTKFNQKQSSDVVLTN